MHGTGGRLGTILFFVASQLSGASLFVPGGRQGQQITAVARPCSSASSQKPRKEKDPSKRKGSEQPAAGPAEACLEVQATAIEAQEYLQAYVREQKWKIADEHAAENAWTFYRNLEKDELLSATKSDTNAARVVWTGGKAFFHVWTTELDGGYTRVSISASFQGYGDNEDQFAPPREFWPLNSNGTLEGQLLSALEAHLKSLH